MSRFNDIGTIAAYINVLEEKARRDRSLRALADLDISDDTKMRILSGYSSLKKKQIIVLPIAFFGSLAIIAIVCALLFGADTSAVDDSPVLMLLSGAAVVLPVYFIISRINQKSDWDKYYRWYKRNKNARHMNIEGLYRELGIEMHKETAAGSNDRIEASMRAEGRTEEQIRAVREARERYQIQNGDLEEPEEMTNERLRKQMKEAGYSDEQIEKAFSENI